MYGILREIFEIKIISKQTKKSNDCELLAIKLKINSVTLKEKNVTDKGLVGVSTMAQPETQFKLSF